ncbi:MAG: TIGR00730 family Rossman fold protein [Anaerolineae bacterium]|nr:TIGR00730 family Rossman fold protein [Anaerolineae bacterium]
MKSICVFCGASDDVDSTYLDSARAMGKGIAQRGLRLVYGGGGTGLMGAVADGALSAGGEVVGIIPEFFNSVEKAHSTLTHMEVVTNLHIRKARMAELVEGFIALPGGFGTLEELFEVLTWSQIGLHHKPIGLLNHQNYFDPLIDFLEAMDQKGFTRQTPSELYHIAKESDGLLASMLNHN